MIEKLLIPESDRTTRLNSTFDFLAGGGEMGALMRAHDWTATPLGAPDTWPSTLKTVIRLVLSSNHPMFVWWGDELVQFYNDGYRQTLGPERHPSALGQLGRLCWQEAWHLIGADIERIMAGGEAAWYEDRLIPVTRFGAREDVWWTYGYSPIEDESGVRGVLVICNDVTADHLLKQRLAETNHALIETMDEGFCIIDLIRAPDGEPLDYRFIEANRAFAQQTGLNDSVGKTIRELVPDIERRWIETYNDIALTGISRRFVEESPVMGRWFNVYATRIDHPSQRRVALLFTDITDRKKAEDALLSSEMEARSGAEKAESAHRRLDALLNSAPVGIAYADEQGGLVAANPMNRVIWGDHPRPGHQDEYVEWLGWWADGSERHGQPVAAHEWPISCALLGEESASGIVEIEPFGSPGVRRVLAICAAPIRDSDGNILGAVAANMDITEQVKAQKALRESEARFRTMADAMPQMVWSASPEGDNTYSNERWREFTGRSAQALRGSAWVSVIHPDDLAALQRNWTRSLREGSPFELEHRIRHRSGEYRWVLNRALPVRDDAGRILQWMGTVTDTHDQKRAAEDLRVANERKDEFLAMLAHELRNPLAPISTAAQILKLPGIDPQRTAHASDVIGRQVRHMVELVDDLLDVSRVHRGLVELDQTPVDVRSVLQGALEQVRPLIDKKGHTLSTRVAASGLVVTGDRKRLIQVLANLLNNAAKYTPEGGHIGVSIDTANGQVSLSVTDDGIGIAASLLPQVFELFTQAERTPDRAQGGLGLGLALVRSIVSLHGGRVEAASDGLGRGSRFTIFLPIDVTATAGANVAPAEDIELPAEVPLHILLVDDNRDAAESLAVVLRTVGHIVAVEDSPSAALRGAREQPFDVCLLAIGLPDIDGYELATRLRNLPWARDAAMVALSGYGQPQDLAASERTGFVHHLVKPVAIPRLLALLKALARR